MNVNFAIPKAGQPDFLAAAQALLPPGDAWPTDETALLSQMLNAAVASMARLHARAGNLTEQEAVPWLAVELLPAWEAAYGLPDPCTPLNATVPQRQAAVLARIAASVPGQTAAVFVAVAAALGYQITVTTFQPAQFGVSTFGCEWYNDSWRYVWQVNAPTLAAFPAQFGTSQFGDPFEAYSGTQLTCVLNRIKPAYSVLIMNY